MINRMTLEIIAPTVEEAIEKGLDQLGLEQDDVDVEILDEGKRNIFRFAARQARIRLTVKSAEAKVEEVIIDDLDEDESEFDLELDDVSEDEDEDLQDYDLADDDLDSNYVKGQIKSTVNKLLDLMKTDAVTTVDLKTSEDDERKFYRVEIEGDDLSLLIGRRAETLNAIQYLVSLMVSHEFGRWIPIQVDIQNYRSRREKELQKLARRIADQVVSTGRKQTLEPMPANERRIIHIELRRRNDVYTESIGEDPYRKVYVYPAE